MTKVESSSQHVREWKWRSHAGEKQPCNYMYDVSIFSRRKSESAICFSISELTLRHGSQLRGFIAVSSRDSGWRNPCIELSIYKVRWFGFFLDHNVSLRKVVICLSFMKCHSCDQVRKVRRSTRGSRYILCDVKGKINLTPYSTLCRQREYLDSLYLKSSGI